MQIDYKEPNSSYIDANIDKMLVPTLLFFLAKKQAHGYELAQKINEAHFCEVKADRATIYRNLRYMEENGLITSKWKIGLTGPAKRCYELSPSGREALTHYVRLISNKVENMQIFLRKYQSSNVKKD